MPPAVTSEENPIFILARQSLLGLFFEKSNFKPFSIEAPLNEGPLKFGQSSAETLPVVLMARVITSDFNFGKNILSSLVNCLSYKFLPK